MATTPPKIDFAAIFTALSPALAAGGAMLVQQLVPGDTKIGADAQAVFVDAFKLVSDIIAAKAAPVAVAPPMVP